MTTYIFEGRIELAYGPNLAGEEYTKNFLGRETLRGLSQDHVHTLTCDTITLPVPGGLSGCAVGQRAALCVSCITPTLGLGIPPD